MNSSADSMVQALPVEGKKALDSFIRVPWSVYRDDPAWIPPLIMERRQALSPRHPFFDHARWQGWIAWRNGQPAGRIAAQVDDLHLEYNDPETGFFGLVDGWRFLLTGGQRKGDRDEDGCPEPDNDGDGVLDAGEEYWAYDSDADGDLDWDNYTDAALALPSGTHVNFDKIRAVRVWILARTRNPLRGYSGTKNFIVGDKVINVNDNFNYRLLTHTVKCRNMGL